MEMYIYTFWGLFMRKIQNFPVREFLSVLPLSVWIPEPEKCFQFVETQARERNVHSLFPGVYNCPGV